MSEEKRGKKRSKAYYRKCAAGGKKSKHMNDLDAGMKGFLVTCNKYERETVREMYNVLNEYADKFYGPETKADADKDSSSDEDEDDMEKAMAKEKSEIIKAAATERRFQNTDTKFKNLIFIRTTIDNPSELAHRMFTDMYETLTQKARYALRLIPVSIVCKAQMKNIEPALKELLAPYFETPFGTGIRFTSMCKVRNNQSVQRCAVLPAIQRIILEMNPLHKLSHDDAELFIIVEVIRKNCCLAVVKDYHKFKKYNFQQVGSTAMKVEDEEDREDVNDDKEMDDKDKDVVKRDDVDGEDKVKGAEKEETEEILDNEVESEAKVGNEVKLGSEVEGEAKVGKEVILKKEVEVENKAKLEFEVKCADNVENEVKSENDVEVDSEAKVEIDVNIESERKAENTSFEQSDDAKEITSTLTDNTANDSVDNNGAIIESNSAIQTTNVNEH